MPKKKLAIEPRAWIDPPSRAGKTYLAGMRNTTAAYPEISHQYLARLVYYTTEVVFQYGGWNQRPAPCILYGVWGSAMDALIQG